MKHIIINKKIEDTFNLLKKVKLMWIITALVFINCFVNGQILYDDYLNLESYVIAKNTNGDVYLHVRDAGSTSWIEVGNTNRTDIQSLSIHLINSTIYAVSNGELGTLSKLDGSFNAIGTIGDGDGENGNIVFDNIYGLTHSFEEGVLYASHRVEGILPGTEDLLIKINIKNGELIKNGFEDDNGNPADYAVIEAVQYNNNGPITSRDVVDISFNPNYNELVVIHTNGDDVNTISVLNTTSGQVEYYLNDIQDKSIEGFSHAGHYFTTLLYTVTTDVNQNNTQSSTLNFYDDDTYFSNADVSLPNSLILDFDFVKKRETNPQSYANLEDYILAKKADDNVYLYKSEAANQAWIEIGNTNRTDIQSLSIHPTNNTIYAVSNGELGTLNKVDGSFNTIATIGNGDGKLGNIVFDNIYGLTHSYTEEALYATQRIDNDQEDLLIKINSETGEIIKNAFEDADGNLTDYIKMQGVIHAEVVSKNVIDIFINPYNNDLLAIHVNDPVYAPQQSDLKITISIINSQDGTVKTTLFNIDKPVTGGSFNNNQYTEDYTIYTVSEANFDNPNNPIESGINQQTTWYGADLLDVPVQGLSILDFDYIKSPCVEHLTINENATTDFQVYPLQRSSKTIITEQTNSSGYDVAIYNQTLDLKSDHIILQPGFMVGEGACLNAVIEPCD